MSEPNGSHSDIQWQDDDNRYRNNGNYGQSMANVTGASQSPSSSVPHQQHPPPPTQQQQQRSTNANSLYVGQEPYGGMGIHHQGPNTGDNYTVLSMGNGNFLKVYHNTDETMNFNNYELFSSNTFVAAHQMLNATAQQHHQPQQQQQQMPETFFHSAASAPQPKPPPPPPPQQNRSTTTSATTNDTNNMFIQQLVENWTPNISGTYLPFGEPTTNVLPAREKFAAPAPPSVNPYNNNSMINLPQTMQQQAPLQQPSIDGGFIGYQKSSGGVEHFIVSPPPPPPPQQQRSLIATVNNEPIHSPSAMNVQSVPHQQQHVNSSTMTATGTNGSFQHERSMKRMDEVKKPRMVAEVKPMRMTYSDVLSKNVSIGGATGSGSNNNRESNTSPNTTSSASATNSTITGSNQPTKSMKNADKKSGYDKKSMGNISGGGDIDNGMMSGSGKSKSSNGNNSSIKFDDTTANKQYFGGTSNTNNQDEHGGEASTAGDSQAKTSATKKRNKNVRGAMKQQSNGAPQQSSAANVNKKRSGGVGADFNNSVPSKSDDKDSLSSSSSSSCSSSKTNGFFYNITKNETESKSGAKQQQQYSSSGPRNNRYNAAAAATTGGQQSSSSSSMKFQQTSMSGGSASVGNQRSSGSNKNAEKSIGPYQQKRTQRSSRQTNSYAILCKLAENALQYIIKCIIWLAALVYDVVVLSYGMWCECLSVGVDYVKHGYEMAKKEWKNCSILPMNYTKRLWQRWDKRFDKDSKWAIWRRIFQRKKIGAEPSPNHSGNSEKLPTTGDEAMHSLLNCKGKNAYSILGVAADCSQEQIRKHYKKIAVLVHPDKNKQAGAEEAFKILQRAFELIGEPENRQSYDQSLAEALNAEKDWSEINDLLSQLQTKIAEAANTIRCSSCGLRHPRRPTARPHFAARECSTCKIRHSAREGDIWAETAVFGLRWKYLALMEGKVYDITEWANCQKGSLSHLQPNSHIVQYRIVLGSQQQQQQQAQHQQQQHQQQQNQQQQQQSQTDRSKHGASEPTWDDYLDNIFSAQNPQQSATGGGGGGGGNSSGSRRRSRKNAN